MFSHSINYYYICDDFFQLKLAVITEIGSSCMVQTLLIYFVENEKNAFQILKKNIISFIKVKI